MNSLNQTYLKLLQDDESDAFQEAGVTLRTIVESLATTHNGVFEPDEDESFE